METFFGGCGAKFTTVNRTRREGMSQNLRPKAKGVRAEAVRVKEVQTFLGGLRCLLDTRWLPTFRADGLEH